MVKKAAEKSASPITSSIASITVCIVTRNAAATITDAIETAHLLTGDVVVVDTGSTDATKKILDEFAADKKLVFHELPQTDEALDYAAARNECLKHAAGDWIMMMDQDEILTPATVRRLRAVLDYQGADAYVLTKRTYTRGDGVSIGSLQNTDDAPLLTQKCVAFTHFSDTRIIRLFKNNTKYRFRYPVFETVEDTLVAQRATLASADIILHCFPSETPEHDLMKKRLFLSILEKQSARTPKDSKLLFDRASLHEALAEQEQALSLYHAAVEADHASKKNPDLLSKNTSLLFRIASIYLKKGDREKAASWMLKSTDANPGFRSGYVVLAALFFQAARPRSALQVLVKALKNNIKDVEILNMVGYGLMQENKLDEALKILEQARTEAEQTGTLYCIDLIYINWYTANLLAGKGDAAIALLQEGIRKYPSVVSFYTNLINLFVQTHQSAQALTYCEKALALELLPDMRKHLETVEKNLKAAGTTP